MTGEWLSQPVPLWAFLIALLTRPAEWSGYARSWLRERLGARGGRAESDQSSTTQDPSEK